MRANDVEVYLNILLVRTAVDDSEWRQKYARSTIQWTGVLNYSFATFLWYDVNNIKSNQIMIDFKVL